MMYLMSTVFEEFEMTTTLLDNTVYTLTQTMVNANLNLEALCSSVTPKLLSLKEQSFLLKMNQACLLEEDPEGRTKQPLLLFMTCMGRPW